LFWTILITWWYCILVWWWENKERWTEKEGCDVGSSGERLEGKKSKITVQLEIVPVLVTIFPKKIPRQVTNMILRSTIP
jgi:hypothetical protein